MVRDDVRRLLERERETDDDETARRLLREAESLLDDADEAGDLRRELERRREALAQSEHYEGSKLGAADDHEGRPPD